MSGTLCFSDMICCSRYILGSIDLDLDHMSPYFFIFSIAKNKTFPRTGFTHLIILDLLDERSDDSYCILVNQS